VSLLTASPASHAAVIFPPKYHSIGQMPKQQHLTQHNINTPTQNLAVFSSSGPKGSVKSLLIASPASHAAASGSDLPLLL
jgi:hypothetical protein